jgi:hypothetical protein
MAGNATKAAANRNERNNAAQPTNAHRDAGLHAPPADDAAPDQSALLTKLGSLAGNLDSRLAGGFDAPLYEQGSNAAGHVRHQQLPDLFVFRGLLSEVKSLLERNTEQPEDARSRKDKKAQVLTKNMTETIRSMVKGEDGM